jgi:hypothetical protein
VGVRMQNHCGECPHKENLVGAAYVETARTSLFLLPFLPVCLLRPRVCVAATWAGSCVERMQLSLCVNCTRRWFSASGTFLVAHVGGSAGVSKR